MGAGGAVMTTRDWLMSYLGAVLLAVAVYAAAVTL
jgi:hypothetical protein